MELQDAVQMEKHGIAGSTLKMIAMVTMLIDHFAATVFEEILFKNPDNWDATGYLRMNAMGIIYTVMRGIGRLAFPIFIFLLVEGFMHTRNRFRYIGRLLIFAVVSEIPFDLAFNLSEKWIRKGHFLEFTYQNVFFTLAIGMIVITILEGIRSMQSDIILRAILSVGVVALGAGLAYVMNTDYDAVGVLAIVAAYLLRNRRKELRIGIPCLLLVLISQLEIVALFDILPVHFYNGERGWSLKWVFYIFYPLHLLILAGICILLF